MGSWCEGDICEIHDSPDECRESDFSCGMDDCDCLDEDDESDEWDCLDEYPYNAQKH